jgi:hypothetical protein
MSNTPTKTPKKTISYAFTPEQYDIVQALAIKEGRKMRNMLFRAVEFYIEQNNIKL